MENQNFTVLIIEDSQPISFILKEILLRLQISSILAHSGQEAKEQLRKGRFDLIVLDLVLPDAHGIEILKRIRKSDKYIPIIIMTSDKSIGREIECFEHAANIYHRKPINFKLLEKQIVSQLELSQSREIHHEKAIILDRRLYSLNFNETTVLLSSSEFRVIQHIFESKGVMVSKQQLKVLLGENVSSNYVDTFISRLRNKLKTVGLEDLIITVRSRGYIINHIYSARS